VIKALPSHHPHPLGQDPRREQRIGRAPGLARVGDARAAADRELQVGGSQGSRESSYRPERGQLRRALDDDETGERRAAAHGEPLIDDQDAEAREVAVDRHAGAEVGNLRRQSASEDVMAVNAGFVHHARLGEDCRDDDVVELRAG